MSTRLGTAEYLAHVRADASALRVAWDKAPDADVTTCPGWSVTSLLEHVGSVFAHKVLVLETAAEPEPGSWATGAPEGISTGDWFEAVTQRLLSALAERPSNSPCWSWWPPEQTVGFWQRRLALETAMHRVDADLACGTDVVVDFALARDGVDEILDWMSWPSLPGLRDARDEVVAILLDAQDDGLVADHGHGHATVWRIVLNAHEAAVSRPVEVDHGQLSSVVGGADAVIAGSAVDMWLRLWGRRPDVGRTLGETEAIALFESGLSDVVR